MNLRSLRALPESRWGHISNGPFWLLSSILLGAILSSILAVQPALLLFIPAVVAVWALTKPYFRLIFLIFGALLVFQTGDGLSAQKILYLAGVTFSVAASLSSIAKNRGTEWLKRTRPALVGAAILGLWVLIPSSLQALAFGGVPVDMWARDALTYLLICAAVVIAVDAGNAVSRLQAHVLTVLVGGVSAVGFTAAWVQKRGFGVDSASQGLLASIVALTVPLALSLVMALSSRRIRLLWLVFAAAIFIAVIVTGTRGGFVLVLAAVGVWGAREKCRIPLSRLLVGVGTAAASVVVALPIAGGLLSSEAFVNERIRLLFETLQAGVGQDYSGVIRQRAQQYALEIFNQSPLFGQGFGIYFPNPNPNSVPSNFTIDTPAMYLAKFGILGTAVLLVSLTMIIAPMVSSWEGSWTPQITVVRGAVITWIAILPFGPTTEDKGFSIAIALGLVLLGLGRGVTVRGGEGAGPARNAAVLDAGMEPKG